MQVGRNWVIYPGLKSDPKCPRSQGSPWGARKALFLQDGEDLAAQAARTCTRTFTSTPETFQYTSQKARGGQTSIKCIFTPGKLRLLPTTSLPPSQNHTSEVFKHPLSPPNQKQFSHPFFFFKCKKSTQDANQSKRDTGYIQKSETR